MKFKVNNSSESAELLDQSNFLIKEFTRNGNDQIASDKEANFVLNLVDLDHPKAYRRKSQEEMVVSFALIKEPRPEMKSACYAALVKSISNMLFCIVMPAGNEPLNAYSITPEVGFMEFTYSPESMYKYMYPVISSHFVLRNHISTDRHLTNDETIPEVDELIAYGKELKKLGALPAPFPLTEFLDQDLIDQLYRLYQIKGLSYGNLSIRNTNHGMEGTTFWMTARGVDKSQLKGIGKDILLVKGYNKKLGEMLVSVPADYDPRIRVSVDAIEHLMIYREFPDVGAIVHVHAWIKDVLCTTQVYPCGTRELAENAVALLRKTPTPGRAEIGLKNHGLTITGPDIRDIFDRIKDRLQTNVPIFN
jgi:hypothetical protein